VDVAKTWTSPAENTWCPGCGNHAVLKALRQALTTAKLDPAEVVIVAGIGQAGKVAHYLGGNYFHGLHGRTLTHALGVRLANHRLKVIAVGGDGDIYGEGGGHLMMMFRRNVDITCLVHNNGVYALTKGQPAPTSDRPVHSKAWPAMVESSAFNPIAAGLAMDATFLARAFAGDIVNLTRVIGDALAHRGFGFVDILQPCVTYNKVQTFEWYSERTYDVSTTGHDPLDPAQARARALEWPNPPGATFRIPTGVIWRSSRAAYEESWPALAEGTLAGRKFEPDRLQREIARLA
jgi:2-oxoglutarate ferredoxin oxidoreductase subunit beta